jgi:hypothetical protein
MYTYFFFLRWLKIQTLGLAKEYVTQSETGQYLKHLFG